MKTKIPLFFILFLGTLSFGIAQTSGPFIHAFYNSSFLGNAYIPYKGQIHDQADYSRTLSPSFSLGWKKRMTYFELEFVEAVDRIGSLEDVDYQEESYYFRFGFGKFLEGLFKEDKMRVGLGVGLGYYWGNYDVDRRNSTRDHHSSMRGITIGVIPRFQYKIIDELVLEGNMTNTISNIARIKTTDYGIVAVVNNATTSGDFSFRNIHLRLSLGYYFNLKRKE